MVMRCAHDVWLHDMHSIHSLAFIWGCRLFCDDIICSVAAVGNLRLIVHTTINRLIVRFHFSPVPRLFSLLGLFGCVCRQTDESKVGMD